jgi:hypothetical protein
MATYSGYAIVQEALTHLGEEYYFGITANYTNQNYGRGTGQGFDCAEFATYCLYQATGIAATMHLTYLFGRIINTGTGRQSLRVD